MKRDTVLSKRRDPIILLTVALVLNMAALLWLGWHVHRFLNEAATTTERDSRIEELRAVMGHLDEVLTMSARMAAATGDLRWEERYRRFKPQLDAAIKEARRYARDGPRATAVARIEAANAKLAEMESRAFNLVRHGRADQARALLLSDEHETQKRLYARGMLWFHPRRCCLRLLQLRGMIVHMDEVLTMSARMAAASGDLRWEERYRRFEPKLDAAIKEAVAIAPEVQSAEAAATTDAANIALVEMENRAFDLVRRGRADEARAVLFSDEYETQKQVYAKGMTDFGSGLATAAATTLEWGFRRALFHLVLAFVPIPFALVSWLAVLRATRKWRSALTESNRGLAGQAEELTRLNQALDRKVAERTAELSNANEGLKREIADRKRAQEALAESEERYRSLTNDVLDSSAVGIFILDADFKVAWVNRSLERYFGLRREAIIGKDKRTLIRERIKDVFEDPDTFVQKVFATYDQNTYIENFVCHVLPEGDREDRWLEHWSQPIRTGLYAGGRIEHYADITERKQPEAGLQRSNAELQEFAYMASHDLQEPLRMVSSYVQLLEQRYAEALDDDAREFIGYAADGAKRMAMLINDLLAYSRVGTRVKPRDPVDCEGVLEDILANLEVTIKESGARVTHDPLPQVMADEGQLARVLQNLVGNALKFCDQAPEVHVSAEKTDGQWRLAVRDNGIGIAPDQRENVFVVFQRLHRRDEYAGTGMGLAISKRIVERHGGRIWVDSEPGKGSTFTFTIPERKEAENEHEHGHGDGAHQAVACPAGGDSAG